MYVDVERELDRLLTADQHDPFQVLGWQIIHREPLSLVIRAFQPRAQSMRLVLGNERLEMYRMRDAGLFEIVLTGTGVPADYLFEVTSADRTVRLLQDPYRFPPQLTEFDQYLFGNGIHYELYNLLGAHLTTIGEVEGVIFRVWAPAARRVSVLANFNDWDGRVHQMRCLGTSGIWELFVPGIAAGEAYKFEIKTRNGAILEKADPFQFHAEPWPKSASIVQCLDYEWQDERWLAARKQSLLHHRPVSIYEVHAGSWQRDPGNPDLFLSFRDLAEKLIPYVKEMNFTHIELLPVTEDVGDEARGFQAGGYFAPISRFGAPEDFMFFIDRCHQSGIGIIIDWASGHLAHIGHEPGRFAGSSLFEEEGHWQHLDGEGAVYQYQKKEGTNFLIASVLFWMDKYHVDGIRMEGVTMMLHRDRAPAAGGGCSGKRENLDAIHFLKHLNGVAAERFPGVLMVADEWSRFFGTTREVARGGLGFDFKWDAGWVSESLNYFCIEPHLRQYHHLTVTQTRPDAWAENVIIPVSYREVAGGKGSLLTRMPGDNWQQFANLRLLFLLLWCQPGKKLLFMGNELGQFSDWRGQVSLDWHLIESPGHHRQLQQFVKELNKFYLENPAVWENDHEAGLQWLVRGDAENSIVVFARHGRTPGDHLVCLFNFTPSVHHGYKMGVPARIQYREILCSDEIRFGGSDVCNPHLKDPFAEAIEGAPFHVRVSVPPLGGLILKPVGEARSHAKTQRRKEEPLI